MTYKWQIKSSDRMSNTQYHKAGKPTWWAYVKVNGETVWATFAKVRGDYHLDTEATIELPGDGEYTLFTGCGPKDRGIRESDTIKAKDGTITY